MSTFLQRLVPLVIAISVVAAPIAESAAAGDAVAGAAKKGKKCKSKKKGKKAGKKAKCKKKQVTAGSPGLPGKPVDPNPPDQPAESDPLLLESLQLTENPLLGGASGPGLVTIGAPAPAGGQAVTLSSGDLSLATLPNGVHIAEGATSADFQVHTSAVLAPASVTLTAAIGTTSVRTTQLDIVDEADLNSLALDYQCFPDDALVNFGDNRVVLNVRAPASTPVALVSSDPFSLSVPSSVSVPATSFFGSFVVNTLQTTPSVTVTASLDGIDRPDTAKVRDSSLSPAPVASTLSLQPSSVIVGDPSTGTVSLDCEPPPGGIVTLVSNDPDVTVPPSVTVPAGELSASFPITTNAGATPHTVQITATAGLGAPAPATLTLLAQPD